MQRKNFDFYAKNFQSNVKNNENITSLMITLALNFLEKIHNCRKSSNTKT